MTKERADALAEEALCACEDDFRGDALKSISTRILTACEEEARETQAAIEAEREACRVCIVECSPYGCGGITEFAFKAAKDILDRGTTNALDEALRKARFDAVWSCMKKVCSNCEIKGYPIPLFKNPDHQWMHHNGWPCHAGFLASDLHSIKKGEG